MPVALSTDKENPDNSMEYFMEGLLMDPFEEKDPFWTLRVIQCSQKQL